MNWPSVRRASLFFLLGYALVTLLTFVRVLDSNQGDGPLSKQDSVFRSGSSLKKKANTITVDASRAPPASLAVLRPPRRRFPSYGTPEFARQCEWALYKGNTGNCTFLARPLGINEGIADWVSHVVGSHFLAMQAGCDLIFDYGPNVNISQVILPFSGSWNWKVPDGFREQPSKRSFDMVHYRMPMTVVLLGKMLGTPLVYAPSFRFTYRLLEMHYLYHDQFEDLKYALPGFEPENGVACSLGSLFRLSPAAAEFEPNLFTRILPALYREDALVMTLYIRTGQADHSAIKERENKSYPFKEDKSYQDLATNILDCALGIEKQKLSENFSYSRVVWMVVSDSQDLKQWITERYDTMSSSNHSIPREVITTTARGAHTRAHRHPSSADFAEALLDWYLIGESDLVVKDGKSPSFGGTAALRTSRPVYDASPEGKCSKITPIHKRTNHETKVESNIKQIGGLRSGSHQANQTDAVSVEPPPRRFPQYGTASFARQCAWTEYKGESRNCTLLLRPIKEGSEGIADWVSQIVATHIYAVQAGCNVMFDYGEGIQVSNVLTPFPNSWNWTIPHDFNCQRGNRCFDINRGYRGLHEKNVEALGNQLRTPLMAYVPSLRFAYHFVGGAFALYRDQFQNVQRVLPSFIPEHAIACSLGSLFRLSPSASQHEPDLFTDILPMLHIESALTIALYIRTGFADESARREKANATDPFKETGNYRDFAQTVIDCALQLEKQKLAENTSLFRVTWIVVSDSRDLKKWISETYTSSTDPRRVIVATRSRGAHTKMAQGPSTNDVAEAILDWYLIGESDIVVKGKKSLSFGGTAALRTDRPLYFAPKGECSRMVSIHERTNETA